MRCVSYHVLHLFFFSVESYEICDAELSALVLRLINVTDSGLHSINRKNGHLISFSFLGTNAFVFIFLFKRAYLLLISG
ncbi:hypothetical protein LOK49_LG01G03758 [Camellia lanceoleosa]|uniref:Uncharacterized protein n=1 Tax=Camellia lanceoleosa TaxID=1840588 RepID=A0ACC0J337_9ERIC|nr:hypothetical protein LOK49_LG01G03758 [Camellia lanceoleosa]